MTNRYSSGPDKLRLRKLYRDFSSPQILEDVASCRGYLKELKKILSKKLSLAGVESYISVANDFILLADKLYAYARLNLYLNTSNDDALRLQRKAATLKRNFLFIETKVADRLSLQQIEKLACKSRIIFAHKNYLTNLVRYKPIKWQSPKGNNAEARYLERVSGQPLSIRGRNYGIDVSSFDPKDGGVNSQEYFSARNAYFLKIQDDVAAALASVKNATLSITKSAKEKDPLSLSLRSAKISKTAVKNLMCTIKDHREIFRKFLDLPCLQHTSEETQFTLQEIRQIVVSSFHAFDENLGNFADKAFKNNFIDFSVSPSRMIGSRHLKVLALKESRIVSRYNGTIKNIFDVAHELGHAFQNHCIMEFETPLNSNIPVSTCEVGAIFCELVVFDYLITNPHFGKRRLFVYDTFLGYLAQAILGVYARFIFEQRLFETVQKNKQRIKAEEVSALMAQMQKNAFNNDDWIDRFLWIYKPHFYSVSEPYYSYPYALGVLFALTIFNREHGCTKSIKARRIYELFQKSGAISAIEFARTLEINLSDPHCFDKAFNWIKDSISAFYLLRGIKKAS